MKLSFSILLSVLSIIVFCSPSIDTSIPILNKKRSASIIDSNVIILVDTVRLKGHIIESVCFPRSFRIYLRKPIDNLSQKKKVLPLIYLDSMFRSELDTTCLSGNNKAYFMDRDDFTGLLKMSLYHLLNDNNDTIYKTYAKLMYESVEPKIDFRSVVIKNGLKKCAIWESNNLDRTFYIFSVPFYLLNRFYPEYIVPGDLIRSDGTVLVAVNR